MKISFLTDVWQVVKGNRYQDRRNRKKNSTRRRKKKTCWVRIVIRAKETVLTNARVIKFAFPVERILLTKENAQKQEKIVINVIKSDTFYAVVEVSKKCVNRMKHLIVWLQLILLTPKMIMI